MTEKQKANELVEKYYETTNYERYDSSIQCAIIAVDEILNVTRGDPYPRKRTHMDKQYWQEVKQHLEEML